MTTIHARQIQLTEIGKILLIEVLYFLHIECKVSFAALCIACRATNIYRLSAVFCLLKFNSPSTGKHTVIKYGG